jgi:hypothetical protein
MTWRASGATPCSSSHLRMKWITFQCPSVKSMPSLRDLLREVLGPVRGIDEIALRIGCNRATLSIASHAKHPDFRG